jgi:hypothetical protein
MRAAKFIFLIGIVFPTILQAQAPLDKRPTATDTAGKIDLIDILRTVLKEKNRQPNLVKKRFYFSILPVSSSLPGGESAFFTSTTAGFYLGDPNNTYLSTINFTPYFNFSGHYGLPVRSNIWFGNNDWLIQGDTRLLVYPQYTWGLGSDPSQGDRLLVSYSYVRFYQSLLKKITPYFFAGMGYNLDYYIDIENSDKSTNPSLIENFTHYPYGTRTDENSFSSGLSVNLVYDTRKNLFNPLPGLYGNVIVRYSPVALGSSNTWASMYLDGRKYISLSNGPKKNILAFWTYYWTVFSTPAPFLDLPAIGMDPYNRSGRGIAQNRYRGKRLLYFEGEYRRDFTRDGFLGMVLFSNLSSASQPTDNHFHYWNPAAGTGLRIKFNKKSDTNICIDYGISRDYSSITIALGEAF